jgi:hypothetical protein
MTKPKSLDEILRWVHPVSPKSIENAKQDIIALIKSAEPKTSKSQWKSEVYDKGKSDTIRAILNKLGEVNNETESRDRKDSGR